MVTGTAVAVTIPSVASAQARISAGAGAGIAGSTEGSLSEGRTAPVVMVQVSTAGPIGIGLEGDGWWRSGSSILVAAADIQLHVPSTPLFLKLGAGVGRGDPDGLGTISGVAGHVGAALDIGPHSSALALSLFGNGFLVYTASRSLQMVDAGLAITRR